MYKATIDSFRQEFIIQALSISEPDAERLGLTAEAIEEYPPQAWIPLMEGKGYLCPNCGHMLGGFLGSFKWGLRHGVGTCSACDAVLLKYYHYVMRGRPEPT